ncbi:MAG: hypothetical protein LBI85_09135 [Spirochaetaceae bacterium]|nr:hypothetical protein [Spirochaetaceae bacterium]
MINYIKSWLIKFSFFLILLYNLFACNSEEKVRYDIEWVIFEKGNVTVNISFRELGETLKEYPFELIPEITKTIYVKKGTHFTGFGLTDNRPLTEKGAVQFYIHNRPDIASVDSTIEIYVYNPIVNFTDGKFIMEKQEGVEAYFVDYTLNSDVYCVISKDNILTIDNEGVSGSLESTLEKIEDADLNYRDELGYLLYPDQPIGGYIVKSRLDNNYIWLITIQW